MNLQFGGDEGLPEWWSRHTAHHFQLCSAVQRLRHETPWGGGVVREIFQLFPDLKMLLFGRGFCIDDSDSLHTQTPAVIVLELVTNGAWKNLYG